MSIRTSLLAGLAVGLMAAALPAQAAGAHACQHLILGPGTAPDHYGNDAPYPSQVDSSDPVNIRWAELRTTRTKLIATIAVKRLNEGESTLDHAYSMTFSNGNQRLELIAMFGRISSWSRATESQTGNNSDDDGVYMGRTLGLIESARDLRHNRVTLTADLSLLGVGNEPLTHLGVQTWSGVAIGIGGSYSVNQKASTTKSYRPGTPDCLS